MEKIKVWNFEKVGNTEIGSVSTKPETILEEAQRITTTDRRDQYGHPYDDFNRIAQLWSGVFGIEVQGWQIPLAMSCVKISRECNGHKRDNSVDGAGYWNTLEMYYEEKARREETNQLSNPP